MSPHYQYRNRYHDNNGGVKKEWTYIQLFDGKQSWTYIQVPDGKSWMDGSCTYSQLPDGKQTWTFSTSFRILCLVVTPCGAITFGGDRLRHLFNLVVTPCGTFNDISRFITLCGTSDFGLRSDPLWHHFCKSDHRISSGCLRKECRY